MNFIKVVKAANAKELAEIYANDYLRDFESKVRGAFRDLQDGLVLEFKLDSLDPFFNKLGKELEDYVSKFDPKIKKEIADRLKERQK